MKHPFGPRHRKQARAMIGESNRRRRSVRIGPDPEIRSVKAHQGGAGPDMTNQLVSHSWVTVQPKALYTDRPSPGWKRSDAAYFGSSVWDGVEPSRPKVGFIEKPGYTALVDNPDAKPVPGSQPLMLPYTISEGDKVVKSGFLPWG